MADSDVSPRAHLYAKEQGLATDPVAFDGGDDGSVWHASRHSVIKAFHRPDNYTHELECYRRLQDADVGKKILGFNVPTLLGYSDRLWVIEMGIVMPPYILDFGKAYLADPQFPDHVVEEWNERMEFWWGDEVKRVRLALFALRRFGIWYYDAKPGNVALENWRPSLDE